MRFLSDSTIVHIFGVLNVVHIFEVSNLSKGPVCIVPMPLVPIAFHGEWDPIGITYDSSSAK